MGDSLAKDLAKRNLELETSESYNEYVVRLRFKRVPNEAVKFNVLAREEEIRRFPFRYIDFVKFPDRHALQSNRKMREAFRAQFRDYFARCSDLPVQECRSYLADFTHLREA